MVLAPGRPEQCDQRKHPPDIGNERCRGAQAGQICRCEIAQPLGEQRQETLEGGDLSDENFDIVQSMLHIGEDYETYCYSNQYSDKNYNEQVCLININKDDVPFPNKTICISTHPNIGVGVIAYAMIKPLPVVVRKEKMIADRITGGVISFVGREENGFPFSSSIVLLKEEDPARIEDPKQWKTIEKHRIAA